MQHIGRYTAQRQNFPRSLGHAFHVVTEQSPQCTPKPESHQNPKEENIHYVGPQRTGYPTDPSNPETNPTDGPTDRTQKALDTWTGSRLKLAL